MRRYNLHHKSACVKPPPEHPHLAKNNAKNLVSVYVKKWAANQLQVSAVMKRSQVSVCLSIQSPWSELMMMRMMMAHRLHWLNTRVFSLIWWCHCQQLLTQQLSIIFYIECLISCDVGGERCSAHLGYNGSQFDPTESYFGSFFKSKGSNLKCFVARFGHHHRLILSIAKWINLISFIKLVFE